MNDVEYCIKVNVMGSVVQKLLVENIKATVLNRTSRGLFIHFGSQKLSYISYDAFRGPLTLNISSNLLNELEIGQGDQIKIFDHELRFTKNKLVLLIEDSNIWSPPCIAGPVRSYQDRKSLALQLAIEVVQKIPPDGESIFYSSLVNFTNNKTNLLNQDSGIEQKIEKLKTQTKLGEYSSISQSLQEFIGLGGGLTPSGDDFVLGYLLSMKRWGTEFHLANGVKRITQSVLPAAYQSTNSLSANLIECACLGLSDERLIAAVDFLATGALPLATVSSGLLSWGNSSGADALMGMITAFASNSL